MGDVAPCRGKVDQRLLQDIGEDQIAVNQQVVIEPHRLGKGDPPIQPVGDHVCFGHIHRHRVNVRGQHQAQTLRAAAIARTAVPAPISATRWAASQSIRSSASRHPRVVL